MHMLDNAAVLILPCRRLQALHRLRCILMTLFTLWPDATPTTRRIVDIDKDVFLRKLSNEPEVKKCYQVTHQITASSLRTRWRPLQCV